MMALALSLALVANSIVAGSPPVVEKCGVITEVDGKSDSALLEGFRVSDLTVTDAPFKLPENAPDHVTVVECGRNSIVPEKNDYKVLLAGYVFAIVAPDGRVLFLEIENGLLMVSVKEGKFTPEEIPKIQAFVNASQEFFYEKPAPTEARQ